MSPDPKDGRYKNLKKGFRDFITASLVEFNDLPARTIKEYGQDFESYMNFFVNSVSSDAFSKWRFDRNGVKRMSSFNSAVYDAVAVGLAEVFTPHDLVMNTERVLAALIDYRDIFRDPDFFHSVTGSVNDVAKVNYRIEAIIGHLLK